MTFINIVFHSSNYHKKDYCLGTKPERGGGPLLGTNPLKGGGPEAWPIPAAIEVGG